MAKIAWIGLIFLTVLVSCKESGQEALSKPKPMTLGEAYPGDIMKADRIELLDGSTGEIAIVEDPDAVRAWIRGIKDIRLEPDGNQEGRVGYRFRISLFEGVASKLDFNPTSIGGVYYKPNQRLDVQVKAFFEDRFGRKF